MKVPFNETAYDLRIIEASKAALAACLKTGWVVTGPETLRAEEYCCKLLEKELAVGFGIAPFFPVAAALKKFFEDTGRHYPVVAVQATAWPEHIACFKTYGFDVDLIDINCAIGGYPQANIPVEKPDVLFVADVHGVCTENIEEISNWCKENEVLLIHDISYGFFAQNIGGFTRTYGDIITMSLNPGKLVNGLNGGMTLTNDTTLYELMKMARLDGLIQSTKDCVIPVGDWRMLEIQAAVLFQGLLVVPEILDFRLELADKYEKAIAKNPALEPYMIKDQSLFSGLDRFTLRIPGKKQEFRDLMNETGIQSVPLTYDHPASWHQIAKTSIRHGINTPVADQWCETHILIPFHNKLTPEEIDFVCDFISGVDIWK